MVTVWPLLLDMGKDDCKRLMRRLELEAYASVVSAFRAQGPLTKEKKALLTEIGNVFSISAERHRAEVRRAVNDEKLATVAERLSGSGNSVEWSIEGRRLVPLVPRNVPQTVFTKVANEASDKAFTNNQMLSMPADTLCEDGAHRRIPAPSSSSYSVSKVCSTASVVLPPTAILPKVSEADGCDSESSLNTQRCSNAINKDTSIPGGLSSIGKPQSGVQSVSIANAPTPTSDGLTKLVETKGIPTSGLAPQSNLGKQKVIIVSSSSPLTSTFLERSQSFTTSRHSTLSTAQKPQVTMSQWKSNILEATGVSQALKPSIKMSVSTEQTTSSIPPSTLVSSASSRLLSSSALLTRPKFYGKAKVPGKGLMPPASLPATLQSKLLPGQKPVIKIKQDSGVKIITKTIGGSGKVITKPINIGSTSAASVVMVTSVPTTVISSKPVSTMSGSSGQVLISSVGGARIVTTSPQFTKTPGQISNIITVTPKSLQHVVGSKSPATTSVIMSKSYPTSSSSIAKPNVIVVQKSQSKTQASKIHRTIPVSNDAQRGGYDVSSSSINRPRISMISNSSSVTSPNIITSTIRFPSPQFTKGTSHVIHKGSMLELMGALKGNKDSKIKTQVIIRPKNLKVLQDGKESVGIHERVLSSDVEKLLTVRRTVSVSPSTVSSKYTGTSVQNVVNASGTNLVSGKKPNTEWIEYDTASSDQSASSAIKALLEFRGKPVKAGGDAPRRSQSIDLSKMAKVPITKKLTTKGSESAPLKLQFFSQGKTTKTITITPQQLSTLESEQAASIIKEIAFQTENSQIETPAPKPPQEKVAPVTLPEIQVTPSQMSFVDQFEEFLEKEGLSEIVNDSLQDTGGKDLLQTAAELTLLKEDILASDLSPESETSRPPSRPPSSKTVVVESVATAEKEFDPYEFDSREDSPVDSYMAKVPSGKVLVESVTAAQKSVSSINPESPTLRKGLLQKSWENEPHTIESFSALQQGAPDTKILKTPATPVMVEPSGLDLSHMQMQDFASQRLEESLDQDDVLTDSTTSATGQSQEEAIQFSSNSSSSDTGGVPDSPGNVRASKRKRKAPVPIDEDASPSQLPSWTRAALHLLQRVSRFRGTNRSKGDPNAASWFTRPVSAIEAPNYHTIVTHPMDFGTIKRKLESQAYEDLNSFHSDMQQVRINCSLYNPPEHPVRVDCEQVFQFYTAEYLKLLEKCQKMQLLAPKSPKRLCLDIQPKSPARLQDF